jgi:hypothetical protein
MRRDVSVLWMIAVGCFVASCGGDAERAAQRARLEQLEQEVRKLGDAQASRKPSSPSGMREFPFELTCPQPWHLHTPLGAALWICRANAPTTDDVYPQCSVTFQPQVAIETKEYFEFALNSAPILREVKNLKDTPTKVNGATAFEATFDADFEPVAMQSLAVLVPHEESTFAVACFAPREVFESYVPAFRKIIGSFEFR